MGIKDLLKFMKPHIKPVHINKYADKRVGIDAYSWLHKGAYSCSMELCLNSDGERRFRYLNYFMHRINLLRHHQVTPVVVFDGGNLPRKATTENERHRRREANRESAMSKLEEGDVKAASELFQRGVSITPVMAHELIQILRSENVEFVVAPYEADAQLAYLASLEAGRGGVQAVITEDSDLLAYGCPATIFKMDRHGNGEELIFNEVFLSAASKYSFKHFDKESFTSMCVLAGCDFLRSVPGIGIVKAYSLMYKYRNIDRVLSILKLEKCGLMPEDYVKSFREAYAVFQHARIYDAEIKKLKHMKPLSEELARYFDGELDFLGPEMLPSVATAIAGGNLDPTNMEAFPTSSSKPIHLVREVRNSMQKSDSSSLSESAQGSAFVVISSNITRKKVTADSMQNVALKVSSCSDIRLDKLLALPSKVPVSKENRVPSEHIPLKFPNNNPFKKRKAEQVHEPETGSKSGIFDISQEDCSSTKRNRAPINESQVGSISEQVSVVTQVESPKPNRSGLCLTVGSQESVSYKSKGVLTGNGKTETLKRKGGNNLDGKNASILNFFPRL